MSDGHNWRVATIYDDTETLIHEGQDFDKVCLRIGQMTLSYGIEQIIVYRDGEEYRRYVLSRQIEQHKEVAYLPSVVEQLCREAYAHLAHVIFGRLPEEEATQAWENSLSERERTLITTITESVVNKITRKEQ